MKFKTLSILFILGFVFSSCKKDNVLTDTELIGEIQKASREMVGASELPAETTSSLQNAFSKWYNSNTELAPEFGYQVRMRRIGGIKIGTLLILYFNLEGKRLESLSDADGFIEGSCEPCSDLIYPVTYIMPDATAIEGVSKEEVELAIRNWYNENFAVEDRPVLEYPVDVILEDGSTQVINDETELENAYFVDCE